MAAETGPPAARPKQRTRIMIDVSPELRRGVKSTLPWVRWLGNYASAPSGPPAP